MKPNGGTRRQGVIGCAVFFLAGLGAIGPARADKPETVSCESEGLDVSDPALTHKTCYKADISSAVGHSTMSIIVATAPSAFLVARRLKAGYRTYFPERSVEEWLSQDGSFKQIQNLTRRGEHSGYTTASFLGTPSNGGSLALSCVAFVHNEGNPAGETDGPSGFLRVVEGEYCKAGSAALSDSEIAAALDSIHI